MADEYALEVWNALNDAPTREPLTEVETLRGEVESLREHYNAAMAHLAQEDYNWTRIFGGNLTDVGKTLDEVKDASAVIREYMIDAPLIGRAADLRQSYIWGKGVVIEGVDTRPTGAGSPPALYRFYHDQQNQDVFFGDDAKPVAENALASDGAFLLLGDVTTKKLERFPLSDVADVLVDPNYPEKVWAYLRQWMDYSTPIAKQKQSWYYTDRAPRDQRRKSLRYGAERVSVDASREIIDLRVNLQVGWPLGIPDLFSSVGWNRTYIRAIKNGVSVTDAMAMIAFKATAGSQKGADNMALRLSQGGQGKAKVAITGVAQGLDSLPSTGHAYAFDEIRPLAALIATGAKVSIVHLLSDPGASGSSYGSAQTLDKPTLKAMMSRQKQWSSFIQRLMRWATNSTTNVKVTFPPIDDAEPIREMQVQATAWGTGLVHADEIRPRVLAIAGMESKNDKAPEGVLLPNNSFSEERTDIDPNGAAYSGPDANRGNPANGGSFVATQGSNDQFGANAGQVGDMRRDVLANSLRALQETDFLDKFEALVARMEHARGDTN
jgi:hypothetical protein